MIEIIKEKQGISVSHMWSNRIDNCASFPELSHLEQVICIYELCLYALGRSGFVDVLVEIIFMQIELFAVSLHATGVHLYHLIG